MKNDIEQMAKDFRFQVRKKAGLDGHWYDASKSMKDWYRYLAKRILELKQ